MKTPGDVARDNKDIDHLLIEASELNSFDEIRKFLMPNYDRLVNLYEDHLLPMEGQYGASGYRSGEETYGFGDIESVKSTLNYISDRWMCAFRVRWLIDLINPNYVLWSGHFNAN